MRTRAALGLSVRPSCSLRYAPRYADVGALTLHPRTKLMAIRRVASDAGNRPPGGYRFGALPGGELSEPLYCACDLDKHRAPRFIFPRGLRSSHLFSGTGFSRFARFLRKGTIRIDASHTASHCGPPSGALGEFLGAHPTMPDRALGAVRLSVF